MPKKLPIPTRAEILERINSGPVQFAVLAETQNSKSERRVAARKICDELTAEGLIVQAYIGQHRYYIANTDDARLAAITQQIEECSRFDSASGCTIWTAYVDDIRGPVARQSLSSTPAALNIRRHLFERHTGKKLKAGESVKMKPACECNCIDPEHMVKKTRGQILKGIPKSMTMRLAMQASMKKHWKTPENIAEIVRGSSKTNTELAKELGMSRSNIWAIRAGRTHMLEQGVFSGLGAR